MLCWHKRFQNHKGSKNTLLSIPAWKVPSPPCSWPWICFSGSWGWRQESTGSHAGRGNSACCCCWGGQRGANQPARMRAVELSMFAISCVSVAFPLTHSLPFPPTPRKHRVRVPASAGVWEQGVRAAPLPAVQGRGVSLCPCPWWVSVSGIPPHCWILSSCSEYEILVSCAAATSPLQSHLLAQTGSRGLAMDL